MSGDGDDRQKDKHVNGASADGEPSGEVIDLANARKRQQTLAKAKADAKKAKTQGAFRAGASSQGARRITFWHWVQFIGFLLLTAYMMRLCARS